VIRFFPLAANSGQYWATGASRVEPALAGEAMRADRGEPLGRRIDVDDRVARPRPRARLVGPSAPQVGDEAAVERDRDRRPGLAAAGEILGKSLAHARKPRVTVSFDRDVSHFVL
jgi:hypothetical protein